MKISMIFLSPGCALRPLSIRNRSTFQGLYSPLFCIQDTGWRGTRMLIRQDPRLQMTRVTYNQWNTSQSCIELLHDKAVDRQNVIHGKIQKACHRVRKEWQFTSIRIFCNIGRVNSSWSIQGIGRSLQFVEKFICFLTRSTFRTMTQYGQFRPQTTTTKPWYMMSASNPIDTTRKKWENLIEAIQHFEADPDHPMCLILFSLFFWKRSRSISNSAYFKIHVNKSCIQSDIVLFCAISEIVLWYTSTFPDLQVHNCDQQSEEMSRFPVDVSKAQIGM